MRILAINCGSSSIKCAVIAGERPPHALDLRIENIGSPELPDIAAAIDALFTQLRARWVEFGELDAVAHRIVHGGSEFTGATLIDDATVAALGKLEHLAPLHNPPALQAVRRARELFARVPQVAVFDTAFHGTLPLAARVYPGPYAWYEQGIERFGFHGISHQYCARRAAEILGRELHGLKLVSCHLGNGASLAAVRDGRSVDTTMGFTPLEGLMMGSRSGSIDPGILVYLARHYGYTASKLDELLNEESGLKGVSGISSDMREIVKAMDRGDERAHLAFDIYTHRLCREIGGMVASLGGIDALAFTAGVGENTPLLRTGICEQLGFLGIRLDEHRNASAPRDVDVSLANSQVRVLVIHTNEEWEIACECCRLLQKER